MPTPAAPTPPTTHRPARPWPADGAPNALRPIKVVVLGAGPGGLYAALLLKAIDPRHDVTVVERNAAAETFGFGVVFSAETLGTLAEADPESYAAVEARFRYWDDIDVHVGGQVVTSTGHGFCGLARRELLVILQERCRELGVRLEFGRDVEDVDAFIRQATRDGADLIIAADGANSRVREARKDVFGPTLSWGACRFTWLGTPRPMTAFTFLFKETEWGLFQAHAYPFDEELGTFIIECHEDTWRRAGLDEADEAATVAFGEALFADWLGGHPLITNRSIWRTFPTIALRQWYDGNVVILGDAAHTAHFSIGSGTKLAMESAIALVDALCRVGVDGPRGVTGALEGYEDDRWVDVARTQKVARTSQTWFEETARHIDQPPVRFAFDLLTRSKQITYDNLARRDEDFIGRVKETFGTVEGAPTALDGAPLTPIFAPLTLRGLTLVNRVVVSPMCQYMSADGLPDDWHLVHLGSRAVGGAGLIITEMTDISPEARISPGCCGMWSDRHAGAWRRITDFVHAHSQAAIALQLAHAGQKGSTRLGWEGYDEPLPAGNWPIVSASAVPYFPFSQVPRPMTRADMDAVTGDFVTAARLAVDAGFDMLELHCAHGYLLSAFLSPLSNRRTDEYGGELANRLRYPLEVFAAVRAVWPADRPMSVRISASDWVEGGNDADDAVAIAHAFAAHGCDVIDVSAGQTSPYAQPDYGRMFQVPFAERIKDEVGVKVMTVGAIQSADHANTVLAAGRADLCAMARPHLADPYLTLHAAAKYGHTDQWWPAPYLGVRPRPARRAYSRAREREREGLPGRDAGG
ncbi:MAG: bifunctional salicylyl-CoA 5-hydroxylase/oxidoreductase [Ardenticatenales bacterium]